MVLSAEEVKFLKIWLRLDGVQMAHTFAFRQNLCIQYSMYPIQHFKDEGSVSISSVNTCRTKTKLLFFKVYSSFAFEKRDMAVKE